MKYDFYGRLTREFPSQITVDATEVCNLACTHCPHPQFKKSEHYSGAMLTPELNEKLANEVKKFSHLTQYIRYTSNGEPLAHPKIYEMMSYAKKHSGVSVTLTTNGKIMNPNSVQKILESQIDLVDISLDAYLPETYAKIRVGGNLENTKKNVLNLIREKQANKSHLKVIVSYIEQPENASETSDFESFWKDQGADYVVVRKLHSAAGSKQNVADEMWNMLNTEKRRACLYPWERVILKANGTIGFCPTDWEDGSSVAHYSTTTIEALWQGEFFNKLRQAHVSGDYSCHAFCGKCPDWSLTSWPGEGRSYADMVEEFDKTTTPVT